MQLSKRLSGIARMATAGNQIIDVGTDHAYLPISFILEQKAPHAIAMDVNKGPLEQARKHIEEWKLSDYIETRLSDGLQELNPDEGGTVIIAGMGGRLICRILEEGQKNLKTVEELILQPQSEQSEVRHFLENHGYSIETEDFVEEDGKFYQIIRAVKGRMHLGAEAYYRYGFLNAVSSNPVLKKFLLNQQQAYLTIQKKLRENESEQTLKRLAEIEEELADIQYLLAEHF